MFLVIRLVYEDFRVQLYCSDENMENYSQIYNWMKGLGYPVRVKYQTVC